MNIDMSYPEFTLDYNSVATAEDWDYLNSFQASMEMPYSSVAVPEDWDYLNSFQAPMEMQNDDIWSELFADVKNEGLNEKGEDPNDEGLLEDLCSSLLVDPDDLIQENNPLSDDQCQQLSPISTSSSSMCFSESSCSPIPRRDKNEKKKKNKEEEKKKCDSEKRFTRRIAFKPKSEKDSFEDGFKWRKYGKKMLRSTPFPRNYYKCMESGCPVKKRVEQDISDPSLLVVTYEGKHNHQSPFMTYYIDEPMLFSQPGSTPTVFIVSDGNFPGILRD